MQVNIEFFQEYKISSNTISLFSHLVNFNALRKVQIVSKVQKKAQNRLPKHHFIILILMIHKNNFKAPHQKVSNKPTVSFTQGQFSHKPLFHYGSLQSIPMISKQHKDQKQSKQQPILKLSNIYRRTPEEQFKRFNSQSCFIYPEKMIMIEDTEVPNYQKKLKVSTGSNDDYKKSIGSKGSRGSVGQQKSKTVNNLKQTSSTTSAETMSATKKQTPAFLKCKSKTMLNKKIVDGRFDHQGFKIYKKIGEGKFGKVYMAKELASGFILAMKIVEKKKIIESGLLEQFIKQLKIQTYLKHPNIIQVYGFFQDQKYFYTLMELGCDGQLYNLISSKKKLTQQATSFISKNLLQAIDHMHSLKILHRDIKPENIVRIMGTVKICDFGWAANKITKQELRSTYCGTPLYLSPQILKGQKYDEKVDLWAIGILAYQLMFGKSPFEVYQQSDLYKIMTDDIKFPTEKYISKQFQQFIQNILNKDPKARLNSSQLLQLKFIKKYGDFETCEQLCE